MPTKKRNFTEEFREEAVRLALISDQPHHDTALRLRAIMRDGQSPLPQPLKASVTEPFSDKTKQPNPAYLC